MITNLIAFSAVTVSLYRYRLCCVSTAPESSLPLDEYVPVSPFLSHLVSGRRLLYTGTHIPASSPPFTGSSCCCYTVTHWWVEVNPGPEDITSKQFGFTTEQIKVNPVLLPDFKYDTIRYDSVCLTCSKKLTGSQLSLPHEVHSRETEGSFPQQATTSISP